MRLAYTGRSARSLSRTGQQCRPAHPRWASRSLAAPRKRYLLQYIYACLIILLATARERLTSFRAITRLRRSEYLGNFLKPPLADQLSKETRSGRSSKVCTQSTASTRPTCPHATTTGAVTPQPNQQQIDCQFPKPILLNTVRIVAKPIEEHAADWKHRASHTSRTSGHRVRSTSRCSA